MTPPPPSQLNPRIPEELDRLTLKALAKKAENRYQTADELLDDLKAVASKLAEDARDKHTRRRGLKSIGSLTGLYLFGNNFICPKQRPKQDAFSL